MSHRFAVPAACAAGIATLSLASLAKELGAGYPAAITVAAALLWLPGRLWLEACAAEAFLRRSPAAALACSLGVLTPALLVPFLLGGSLAWSLPGYAATMVALAVGAARARRGAAACGQAAPGRGIPPGRILRSATCLLTVAAAAAAVWFTSAASIDRWWYLAYVRSYLDAPGLSFSEPFFGSVTTVGRFLFHTWLSALALWARQSGADPIFLYERVCPLLLVPAAVSAAVCFGRVLFGSGRAAWTLALVSLLLWTSGGPFPALARLPEDKFLALLVIAPVTAVAALGFLRAPDLRTAAVLGASLLAQACVHPLVYVLAAAPLTWAALWLLASRRVGVAAAAALVVALAIGALYPAASGASARRALIADGATLAQPDHPVVRVHLGRERLALSANGSYRVRASLLAHPLTLLALLCIPLVYLRPAWERAYLLPASVIPPLIAFLPSAAALAGAVVLPWMVYRVLWMVPYAALLTLGIEEASTRIARGRATAFHARPWLGHGLATVSLVLVAIPSIAGVVQARFSERRLALAAPEAGPFREAMRAVSALDPASVIAASAEISERIPAFTGRHILAASDRASVVFAGSREAGERRLRARARWMAGLGGGASEGEPVPPVPTHLLIEPDGPAAAGCSRELFRAEGFLLCEASVRPGTPLPVLRFEREPAPSPSPARARIELAAPPTPGPWQVACDPSPKDGALGHERPGPWSAAQAHVRCTVRAEAGFEPRRLLLEPRLGRAVEEFTVTVRAGLGTIPSWTGLARARLHQGERGRLDLPAGVVDTLEVEVFPEFLPFVKLDSMSLEVEPVPQPRDRDALPAASPRD